MKSYNFLLIFLLALFMGCKKESLLLEYRIEEGLEVYVDRFFSEAEKRGVFIEKENLILEFTEVINDDFCGQCERPKRNRAGQRIVSISTDPICWFRESDQNKEALVFHELGHCLLGRDHKDDLFLSGAPRSIMTTILEGPYQPCIYVFGGEEDVKKCNLTVRREYYIDELFDENLTTVPEWALPGEN
ncbi:hypothetical protein [Jiulongibacter sediminis]|jgi:hypothetical protein|uniref:hypothetical protein n=1 Tax=Jiulongibacter sediminis TaxID=1605367 RepID=UPI0026E9CF19|nr:hypothetical protein [Jiulongibacter sediminis]